MNNYGVQKSWKRICKNIFIVNDIENIKKL